MATNPLSEQLLLHSVERGPPTRSIPPKPLIFFGASPTKAAKSTTKSLRPERCVGDHSHPCYRAHRSPAAAPWCPAPGSRSPVPPSPAAAPGACPLGRRNDDGAPWASRRQPGGRARLPAFHATSSCWLAPQAHREWKVIPPDFHPEDLSPVAVFCAVEVPEERDSEIITKIPRFLLSQKHFLARSAWLVAHHQILPLMDLVVQATPPPFDPSQTTFKKSPKNPNPCGADGYSYPKAYSPMHPASPLSSRSPALRASLDGHSAAESILSRSRVAQPKDEFLTSKYLAS